MNLESMIVRTMQEDELQAVQEVVKAAFYNPDKNQEFNEWNFVKDVMKDDGYVSALNLVAVLDGSIVGHILFTQAMINECRGLTLGPIAVHPKFQAMGIGSELVKAGFDRATTMGYEWIALLGGDYYLKFGYESAEKNGIILSEESPLNAHLKIRYIDENVRESVRGILKFCDSFYNESGELL